MRKVVRELEELAIQESELGEAVCFRCKIPGRKLYKIGPFWIVQCPDCLQVFVSPRLNSQGVRRFYENPCYFERIYGERNRFARFLEHTWTNGRLDLIAQYLGSEKGQLLDVGCAHGLFLKAARNRGYKISGIEFSKIAAIYASKLLNIEVLHGELERANFPKDKFDVVCFWDVLEHVPDPGLFIKTTYDILRPGGLAALSCPYFDSPFTVLQQKYPAMKPAEHIWHFTTKDLRRLLGENGFVIMRIQKNPLSRSNFNRLVSLVVIARKM